jgi:putative ABC transport system permease protein
MIRHHIKIALRNLLNNRVYSLINIGGLAIGLAACLAIGLYVADEYGYDRFHRHFHHIYRIVETQKQADGYHLVAVTPGPLAPNLQKDFAEIVQTTRVGQWPALLQTEQQIAESKALMVENSFFKIFDFPLLLGNPSTVLLGPDEVVINEDLATRFFGVNWLHASVLGKTIRLNGQPNVTIVGVVKNPPANSHLQFEALLPFKWLEKNDEWSMKWNSNNYHTYVQLQPGADAGAFGQKIATSLARYNNANDAVLQLQPLRDIYLRSRFDFQTDWGKRSDIFYVHIFLSVGLVVLLIALFNFVNLSTARASERAREVGVRKSVGADRRRLIAQFLGESFLMTAFSVLAALLLLDLFLPLFNDLTEKELVLPWDRLHSWAALALVTVVVSLFAGLYPAFILSAFRPASVLKGMVEKQSGLGFRKTLVVGQFVLSIALGIGTIVIYRQMNFVQHKNLGFDQSQLLYLQMKGDARFKSAIFKHEIAQLPGVLSVSATTSNLVDVSNSTNIEWQGQIPNDEFLITQMNIDADFVPTTGMQVVSGRNVSAEIAGDTLEKMGRYLLNETAVRRMGYTNESALGKKIKFWGLEGKVVGVLRDFHFRPLSKTIEPFVFRFRPRDPYFTLLIKTQAGQTANAIAAVEQVYTKLDPNNPIKYGFVDQDLDAQYRAEHLTGSIVLDFSILAILISCLGLFGLVTFSAETRRKEIGIRKVLGASVAGITALLARDFLKLVVIAIVIASPVAYYFMQRWLSDFAYRIEMEWWMFAGAGILAVVIALLTVGFQSVRAALANPTNSLKNE